jgi:3-oxoacyl-[acyl-carrier-protein] synthase II
MKHRVVVTGLGIISPVGNDKNRFWQSLVDGRSGVGRITSFDASRFDSQVAGEVKEFNPSGAIPPKDLKRIGKFVQYAVVASKEAIVDSGLDLEREDLNRIGVMVGSGIGSLYTIEQEYQVLLEKGPAKLSPFLIPKLIVNMAPGYISIALGLKGPNSCVATACASGGHAIGEAFRILQRADADVMVAGGAESCITPLGVGGFCAMKALSTKNNHKPSSASRPFDKERDGFVIAEGAGIAVLETLEHASNRGARIYAEVVGLGMSGDAYHITAPDPDGDGAYRAMRLSLEDAGIRTEEVSYINAHGTSTPLNDKVETLAIKRLFKGYSSKLAVSSTKSMTGHLLGAAGGVEFVACCLSIHNNAVPPTINYEFPDPECDLDYVPNQTRSMEVNVAMSNSLGFGGHNVTLVVKKFK